MDAVIEVSPAVAMATVTDFVTTLVTKIITMVKAIVTLVTASITAPSVSGHSISAVAPDFDNLNGGPAEAN